MSLKPPWAEDEILSQKGDRVRREGEESHSWEREEERKWASPLPLSRWSPAASRHTFLSSGDSGRHNWTLLPYIKNTEFFFLQVLLYWKGQGQHLHLPYVHFLLIQST